MREDRMQRCRDDHINHVGHLMAVRKGLVHPPPLRPPGRRVNFRSAATATPPPRTRAEVRVRAADRSLQLLLAEGGASAASVFVTTSRNSNQSAPYHSNAGLAVINTFSACLHVSRHSAIKTLPLANLEKNPKNCRLMSLYRFSDPEAAIW